MRQTRLVLMAAGGVLLLCVLAVVISLQSYTSSPSAVAVAHIPPVVGPANAAAETPTPTPVPPITVITDAPTPTAGSNPSRGQAQQSLAQLLQQLEQRRHHRPPG